VLVPEQEELLAVLVEASARVPRVRQQFALLDHRDDGRTILEGADLPADYEVLGSDVWQLHLAELIDTSYQNYAFDPAMLFTVSAKGRAYYAARNRTAEAAPTVPAPPYIPDMAQPVSFFISYSHSDKALATALEAALKARGCAVWRDENELLAGDSLAERISEAVLEVEFMAVLVSEASTSSDWCKKELSLALTRGLNEGRVTVMPLRVAEAAMPPALSDAMWVPIDASTVEAAADKLVRDAAAHRARKTSRAQPSVPSGAALSPAAAADAAEAGRDTDLYKPIKITGVVEDEVGRPRNDGTRGSGLYRVPLALSGRPSPLWAKIFKETWDHPPRFGTMHRPGIGFVVGNKIILSETTIEEVERIHADTLKAVIPEVNRKVEEIERAERDRATREADARSAHDDAVRRSARRMSFDDE
jgi:hypothetical protein